MPAEQLVSQQLEIGRICRRNVSSIAPAADIGAAARVMREKHVGFLVVTEPGREPGRERVVGVLTDRDIVVAVVAREAEPRSLKVGDVMTRNPLLIGEDMPLDAALGFMRDAGVRRVPVVGSRGELTGAHERYSRFVDYGRRLEAKLPHPRRRRRSGVSSALSQAAASRSESLSAASI